MIRPANGSAIVLKTKAAARRSTRARVDVARARHASPATARPRRSGRAARACRGSSSRRRRRPGTRSPRVTAGLSAVATSSARELLALEVALHQRLVDLDDLVEELLAGTPARAPAMLVGDRRRARPRLPPSGVVYAHMWSTSTIPGELVLGADRDGARRRSSPRAAPGAGRARGRSRRARGRAWFTKRTRASPSSSARFTAARSRPRRPSRRETTTSAPSTTRSAQRASPWKHGSPGTSTRLIFRPCQSECVRDSGDRHLRRCSSSSQSETVVPASIVPSRFSSPALEEQRLDEGRLARPAMADDCDVADLPGLLRHERSFRPAGLAWRDCTDPRASAELAESRAGFGDV